MIIIKLKLLRDFQVLRQMLYMDVVSNKWVLICHGLLTFVNRKGKQSVKEHSFSMMVG